MARTLDRLSARAPTLLKKRGLHADGGGLYLKIDDSKRWVFIYQWAKKRTEMGLGSAAEVSLKEARRERDAAKAHLRAGRNPIEERRKAQAQQTTDTFGDIADEWHKTQIPALTSKPARDRLKRIVEHHLAPLRGLTCGEVTTPKILEMLSPIWDELPEMAPRVRTAAEDILDAAKVKGLREGDNPARWKGHLEHVLSAPRKLTRGHHASMPYIDVPDFVMRLRALPLLTARMVEFTILTVARPTEGREGSWAEVSRPSSLWTVPAERMKERREHRVPLVPDAISLLDELPVAQDAWLFPGERPGKAISNPSGAKLMAFMGVGQYTVHGFRSSFRTWVQECTDFPDWLAEAALAHLSGDKVERAYKRGEALEKRRRLMQAWADFLSAPRPPSEARCECTIGRSTSRRIHAG